MTALPIGRTARQLAEAFAVSDTEDPLPYNAAAVVAELVDAAKADDSIAMIELMNPLLINPQMLGAVLSLLARLVAANEFEKERS